MENLIINNVTVTVIFNRDKRLEKGAPTAAVTIRVYVPKEGTTHIDTGVKVDKTNFQDKYKYWIKANFPNATAHNLKILNILSKISNEVIRCDLANEKFAISMIQINGTEAQKVTKIRKPDNTCFLTFFKMELEKKDVRDSSKGTYKTVLTQLGKHYPQLPFAKLDYNFVKDFDSKLQSEKVTNNGRIGYMRILKVFLTEAVNCQFISPETLVQINRFKIKKEETKRNELSQNEILILENYQTEDKKIELICDFFLFALYTGLAYSDASNLLKDEISNTQEHGFIISKRRKKTNEISTIPIALLFEGKAVALIEKYKNTDNLFCFPALVRTNFRYALLQLFESLNFKAYTMHCARHTFAAHCINSGLDKNLLQKMLGHTQSATTDIYAKVNIGGIVSGIKNSNLVNN